MNNSFSKTAAISFGWDKFKENILLLLAVFFIIGGVSFMFNVSDKLGFSALMMLVVGLVSFVVQSVLEMGAIRIVLNIRAGHKAEFANLISEMSQLLNFILAQILVLVVVMIGTMLLIIPGIIATVGLFFVPYIVIDKKLGPVEAMKESWRLTKGHKWNLLWFGSILIIMNMLGMMAFGIGLLVTLPISFLATVYAYKWLDTHDAPVVQK